ncbi:MAG TPA: 30S ribosome-binding factor RbfA [Pilimelia sp.]|nr:30S ribosome-binding factor RbfA [Pilimelia sp.]
MTDPARVRRHAERVRELVASVVRTQIKDPRLGMITITDARITADLREATVFYTVLGDAAAEAGTAAALESAKGLLRSTVGKALGLRHSPTLAFVLDNVLDHAKHIDDLLAAARHADAEVQRLAAQARYAGDAQPYRLDEPADDEDDDGFDDDAAEVERVGGERVGVDAVEERR